MSRRQLLLAAFAGLLIWPAVYSLTRLEAAKGTSQTLVSNAYRLDKIYRSMEGPMSIQSRIHVGETQKCPVQWITGLETEVVDATEQNPMSQEFFCHSNLTFAEHSGTPDQFNKELGGKTHLDWRLFTLVPGRLAIDLPPGFGVPVPSDAPLDYVTMSLNLNVRNEVVSVRMRTKLHSIAADQPDAPTKALFRRALYVLQPPADMAGMGHACMASSMSDHVGAGCGEMSKVILSQGTTGLTNHWSVTPGRHIYKTEITPQLNLPFDTTIHYATIHVHPFARGIELRDLTTGKTVLRLNSNDWPDRVGVAHVDEFKSVEGIPIVRGHRYELSAEYDNSSGSNTDAMAILYLYLLEKNLT